MASVDRTRAGLQYRIRDQLRGFQRRQALHLLERQPGAAHAGSDGADCSYIYELPIGHGKRLAGQAGSALNTVVGGWQVAGVATISSGNWFSVTDNGNFSNSDGGAGGNSERPNQIGDPTARPCVPGTFFNTCAFTDPPLGSFGNVGRNTLQGPGYVIWDTSLFKTFRLSERFHLEFRSEFFNLLNHTNFLLSQSGPQESNNSTVLGTSQFGFLTAARAPRQIQFGVKLLF